MSGEPIEISHAVVEQFEQDYPHFRWTMKAKRNLGKWGEQGTETLLLAMQEELGELSQAHLEAEHESGDPDRTTEELDDLAALCYQLLWKLEGRDVPPVDPDE